MITSFGAAIVGYALLSGVAILDKFILSKSVKNPATYTFYSTIFFCFLILVLPFTIIPSFQNILVSLFSGITLGFGLWAFFISLKRGEASHIVPFVGATTAIVTYGVSSYFLKEHLSAMQMIGLSLLIIACIFFSFEKSVKHSGFHRGFLWAILSGTLFAFSAVSAKYIYILYPFFSGLMWTKVGTGIVGLFILMLPKTLAQGKESGDKKNVRMIVCIDKIAGVIAILLIQYAIAIGSVTIVNAMAGIEYAFTIILIYFMTKIFPKIFSEYFTRNELSLEIVAIVLVVAGIFFLR